MPAMAIETDTIIIGAGPAGLAVGAVLRRADVPFVMLERGQRVGESWYRHYERLHLHTPKRHSALPYRPYPRTYPRYPSRQQMVDYLEDYARAFDLRPAFGREVRQCARRADGVWEVSTAEGPYRGRRVVVAAGASRVPHVPRWPGQETFPGPILHSRDYANGAAFRGQRVLVVGFGNSGAEIALDLLEHGARPAVAVRGPVNVIPRDLLGIPIIVCALACRRLAPRVADALNALALRLAVGDLASAGLAKRADGPFTQVAEGRQTPVIDVGTMARIRRGEIAVRRGWSRSTGRRPLRRRHARALRRGGARDRVHHRAAGPPPDYPSVLDSHGQPRRHGCEAAVPGLYFCGYDLATTGLLRQIGIEARHVGRDIAAKASAARSAVS
jgi:hypothetical protein